MKLVHTADWHLGQSLGPYARDVEHGHFLAWLLELLENERADALLVCGDVFDQGSPPPAALARYYDFLAEARRRLPALDIVVIGGNHDAAPRLDAPGPVLRQLGVHVVGALPRGEHERCLVPLRGKSGEIEAWCAAVPFLRLADLPPAPDANADPIIDGVARIYAALVDAARARSNNGEALVALGHCHMAGGRVTDDSERALFGGGHAHALPVDLFPDDVAYAALGHLHFAQQVGGRDNVRYSGSPLPLSMTERAYRHQVLVVDVAARGAEPTRVTAHAVPRLVDLLRVPEEPAPLDEVLDRLRALDVAERPEDERPFLEVRVRLDKPAPDLRTRVELALEGKPVRLLRVQRELAGAGAPLADQLVASSLADLEPALVFERLYDRTFGGAVPANLAAAFEELLTTARGQSGQLRGPPELS